jgi:hypothetical protein
MLKPFANKVKTSTVTMAKSSPIMKKWRSLWVPVGSLLMLTEAGNVVAMKMRTVWFVSMYPKRLN